MYLMFADETNLDDRKREIEFFLYGGLAVEGEDAGSLSLAISRIRRGAGFEEEDSLKFQRSSRPKAISVGSWNDAKGAVLDACAEHNAKLFVVGIHHRIADEDRIFDYQVNMLLDAYNKLLSRKLTYGAFLMDRLGKNKEFALMQRKFCSGGETAWGSNKKYASVIAYGSTGDRLSHLASAADIALGTIGYCVNDRRPDATRPKELFPRVARLLYAQGSRYVWDKGFILMPKDVIAYRDEYDGLKAHLRAIGLDDST